MKNDRTDNLIIQDEEGQFASYKYQRKILVYGFCNTLYLGNKELHSACCIDCWAGMHPGSKETIHKLQVGDYVKTNHENNYINIIYDGMRLTVQEFIVGGEIRKNERD